MSKHKPLLLAIASCGLLQGCTMPPVQQAHRIEPVLRVAQPGNRTTEWNQLARYHHERGQLALALGAYAQSLALDVNQLEARNAVAVIEAQQGNLEGARKALVALVNDYPGEAQPHTNLGYVQYLMGDHASAAQTLRRAMALGAGPKAFQNLQLAEAAIRPADANQPMTAAAGAGAPAAAQASASASAPTPALAPATAAVSAPAPAPLRAPEPVLAAAEPESPAYVPRAPKPTMAISPDAQQIASRMELVQLSPNIFELKQRVAVAAAPEVPAARMNKPAPESVAQAALAAVPKANRVQMARLEVSNGNGVTGMAKRFRSLLGQMGIPVDRLSNDKPYRQVVTTIQYSPGFESQAASLRKALQGKAQLASRQLQNSDVRLVLGKDAQQSLAAAAEAAGLHLVAAISDEE
jgi:tetratricopeptide (TPR) repeat protein